MLPRFPEFIEIGATPDIPEPMALTVDVAGFAPKLKAFVDAAGKLKDGAEVTSDGADDTTGIDGIDGAVVLPNPIDPPPKLKLLVVFGASTVDTPNLIPPVLVNDDENTG